MYMLRHGRKVSKLSLTSSICKLNLSPLQLNLPPLADTSPAKITAMHCQFKLLSGLAVDEAFAKY